jgi:hypothetical protein
MDNLQVNREKKAKRKKEKPNLLKGWVHPRYFSTYGILTPVINSSVLANHNAGTWLWTKIRASETQVADTATLV